MTVIATSYSSIDEVWADSYLSPQLQKPKKNKSLKAVQKDPLCDLYEMGNNTTYDDTDLVSFANKYFEKHQKIKHQKPRMQTRDVQPRVVDVDIPDELPFNESAPVREPPPRTPELQQERFDADDSESEDNYNYRPSKSATKETFHEDDMFGRKNTTFNQMDLVLYIISGIILIFMMDQFVKIGQLMK